MTPGSRSPHRVPIMKPPAGVRPMLVSIDRPSRTAAMLAPFPRCAMTTRPRRAEARDDVFVRKPVEAEPMPAGLGQLARQRKALRHLGQTAVKGRVEAHHLRQRRIARGYRLDTREITGHVQR